MPRIRKQPLQNSEYLTFFRAFDTYPNEHKLSKHDFHIIIKCFFYIMMKEMLTKGTSFSFPNRLGIFGIAKTATFGRGYFDYQLYRKTGVKRYIQNNHSSKLAVRIKWTRPLSIIKDRLIYMFAFSPARDFARELATHIKNNNAINKYYD